jgi:hypothetical protein
LSDEFEFRLEDDVGIPSIHLVEDYLEVLIDFINEKKVRVVKTNNLTDLHYRLLLSVLFLKRYPFAKGNGRTARLLFSILTKPFCAGLPIPLFFSQDENPREFYMKSIRANPSRAPLCFAFYALKCLAENAERIKDALQPLGQLEPARMRMVADDNLNQILSALVEDYPSLKLNDIHWLSQNPHRYLVILGKRSCYEPPNAEVHHVEKDKAKAILTVNMQVFKLSFTIKCLNDSSRRD